MQKNPLARLFHEKMVYEGRLDDFISLAEKILSEKSCSRESAVSQAMREMGFIDRKHTQHCIASWRKHCSSYKKRDKTLEEAREERRADDFENAIRDLPPRCSPEEYWNWIGAHPALSRKGRQKDKTKELVLTVEDVMSASHGVAPSQEAVHALQFYANNVGKFYEYRDAYMKKAKVGTTETEKVIEKDVGIEDIKALMNEIGG